MRRHRVPTSERHERGVLRLESDQTARLYVKGERGGTGVRSAERGTNLLIASVKSIIIYEFFHFFAYHFTFYATYPLCKSQSHMMSKIVLQQKMMALLVISSISIIIVHDTE